MLRVGRLEHLDHVHDLAAAGKIPKDLMDKLPPAEGYAKAVFPTLEEQNTYKKTITEKWDSVVGANVQ